MMDPVLAIIIASCMTLTQFAIQLRDNISTSAYLKNFELMLDAVQSIHSFLESTKKFKSWGSTTDAAKKAFQKLEDTLRKSTGLLQRCISARSKLLQLVSQQALKKADFMSACVELDEVLALVPTDAMPDVLSAQLDKVRKKLQATPFVESITPEMKATFERLLKEESGGGKTPGGGRFAAGQLAEQLGLGDGQTAFRKEQEALALERRKAVEGGDKAQEILLEQVALVLARMEREMSAYLEIKKLKESAANLTIPPLRPRAAAPPPPAQPAPEPPPNTMTAAQRAMVSAVEEMSLKEGVSSPGGGGAAAPGGRATGRSSSRRQPPQPSFEGWVVDKAAAAVAEGDDGRGVGRSGSQHHQQHQQQQARPAGDIGDGGESRQTAASRSPRQHVQQHGAAAGAATSRSPRPRPPADRGFDDRSAGGPTSVGTMAPQPPPSADPSSGRPKGRSFETNVSPNGGAGESKDGATKNEESSGGGGWQATDSGPDVGGRQDSSGLMLNPDLGPETDLATIDPDAPFQVVQSLLYGTPTEQCQAAGLVGWYTMFSGANRATFRNAGAVDALVPLASSKDSKTVEAAIGALLNLSSEEQSKADLQEQLPQLVQMLKRVDTPAARAGAANVLKNVASRSAEARAAAIDAGAVPHLVKLLAADDMSKQAAAEALACLAECEPRRSKIVAHGAVMPLALALRSNPVPETLTAICSSLASLAAVPEGREAMGLGVPSLVNVLRLDYPDALKDAVEALLLLARHSPTYRSSIRNNGGMRYLRNVLRSGPPTLHPKAMELLAALFS